MCRYLAYLGQPLRIEDLVYRPSNSLIRQAAEAMESPTRINADGFGVGWYSPALHGEPAVFKDVTPAWNNGNLRSLAGKVASGCILAHVRAAQRNDPISRANCHPFQDGRLLWMHNGDIPGRGRLHRRVVAAAGDDLVARINGNTDTELAFVLFRTFLGEVPSRSSTAGRLAGAMRETIRRITLWQAESNDSRPLALNFCVTDGRSLVATRYAEHEPDLPTLHYCVGRRYVCEEGVCRMERDAGDERCVIVASERLTADEHWIDVRPGDMIVVREDLMVEVHPLGN